MKLTFREKISQLTAFVNNKVDMFGFAENYSLKPAFRLLQLRPRIPTGSAQGSLSVPAGAQRLPWETVPTNSSTLKALHQIHRRRIAPTPSELSSFCPFTQRSPTASVNAGLNAATALRLVRRAGLTYLPGVAGASGGFAEASICACSSR